MTLVKSGASRTIDAGEEMKWRRRCENIAIALEGADAAAWKKLGGASTMRRRRVIWQYRRRKARSKCCNGGGEAKEQAKIMAVFAAKYLLASAKQWR
jgi:hypothetical protein